MGSKVKRERKFKVSWKILTRRIEETLGVFVVRIIYQY